MNNESFWFQCAGKILVGTKADLPRHVTYETAKKWADAHQFLYVEVSSKTKENMTTLLGYISDQFWIYREKAFGDKHILH